MSKNMPKKTKSPASEDARLGDLVLSDKNKIEKILSKLRREVNPCDVSDLVLGPFYEIMGRMNPGRK